MEASQNVRNLLTGTITNAPHIPRGAAFLDSGDMIRNPVHVFEKYRARLGPTFTFHFGGAQGAIVSTEPDFIQHVLQKNQTNYKKSDIQVKRMGEFQGQGLLNSHGQHWLRQRRFVAQSFLRDRLAKRVPAQRRVLEQSMSHFVRQVEHGPVDVYQQMVRFTLRIVGGSLFGKELEDEELEQLALAISKIQGFIVRQIVQPYKIPWFRISGQSAHYQQIRIDADKIVRAYVKARARRVQHDGGDGDVLQFMLETPYSDTGEKMDHEQVLTEILQLLVAGNETSSTALAWAFYLLARHPKYIGKIRQEITQTFGDGPVDFDGLQRLQLTTQVLKESMRIYPSFWMIDRVAVDDDEICGVRIPAGATVIPYIYGTHRNTDFWQDPETFDPSRFEPARAKQRHSFAHIPFGGGSRVCVAARMAMTQMLMILVGVVRNYDFSLATDGPVDIDPMMILRPNKAMNMRFVRV